MSKENEQKPFNGLTEALTFKDVINYKYHSMGEYADVFDERMYELFKSLGFNRDINAYLEFEPASSLQLLTKVWKNPDGIHWIELKVYTFSESHGYCFEFSMKAKKVMSNSEILIATGYDKKCSTPAELFKIELMNDLLIASGLK